MKVIIDNFPNILEPWTKIYFYSIGLGEWWEETVRIGEIILQQEEE